MPTYRECPVLVRYHLCTSCVVLIQFVGGRFEIVFPRRMAWAMKIYRCLPYSLAMAIAKRLIPQDASGGRSGS